MQTFSDINEDTHTGRCLKNNSSIKISVGEQNLQGISSDISQWETSRHKTRSEQLQQQARSQHKPTVKWL